MPKPVGQWISNYMVDYEPACAAPTRMAARKHFMVFFCGRGEVGGGNSRLLGDKSIESCLTEQHCSVLCVTFYFVLLLVRP